MSSPNPSPFFKNVLLLALCGSIAQILGFLVIVLLGKRLGASLFGELSFAQASLVYLMLLADIGLKTLGTRQIAQSRSLKDKFVMGAWSWRIMLALIVVTIWSFVIYLLPISSPRNWLIWGYSLSLLPLAISTDWVFTGLEKLGPVAMSRLIRGVIHLGLAYWLIKSAADWFWAPTLSGVSWMLIAIFLLLMASRNHLVPSFSLNLSVMPQLARQAIPLGISAAMIQVYYYLDSLLLGVMRTTEELGYYSAAYKVILFLLAIADTLGTVLLPTLSRLSSEGMDHLRAALREVVQLLLWVGVGFNVGVLCLARESLTFLFGESYLPGTTAMMILSGTLITVFGNLAFGITLIALKREKKYTIAVSFGALINLLLNLFMIPTLGIIGAAITTIASESMVWGCYLYFLRKDHLQLPWLNLIIRLLIAGSLMAVALLFIQGHVIFRAIIGTLVYFAASRLVGLWSLDWLKKVSSLLGIAKGSHAESVVS
jgi:O-antigen/teichoic acid export membrane protein